MQVNNSKTPHRYPPTGGHDLAHRAPHVVVYSYPATPSPNRLETLRLASWERQRSDDEALRAYQHAQRRSPRYQPLCVAGRPPDEDCQRLQSGARSQLLFRPPYEPNSTHRWFTGRARLLRPLSNAAAKRRNRRQPVALGRVSQGQRPRTPGTRARRNLFGRAGCRLSGRWQGKQVSYPRSSIRHLLTCLPLESVLVCGRGYP